MADTADQITCPITGKLVQVIECSYGDFRSKGYMGRIEAEYGGYCTKVFDHKEQLVDFFKRRGGVMKGKASYNPPKIEVREPTSDSGAQEAARQETRDLDDKAQSGAERIIRTVRK